MTHPYPQTPRTSPARNAQRVSYDQETVHAVLDEAVVCHVGFVVEGRPVVLPHLHARLEEVLYLHGSTGARAMHAARGDGLEVCVTVTLLDSLVLARSAFHHSVNYRSVVVHGTAAVVEDPQEKTTALAALVEAWHRAGRAVLGRPHEASWRPRRSFGLTFTRCRSRSAPDRPTTIPKTSGFPTGPACCP